MPFEERRLAPVTSCSLSAQRFLVVSQCLRTFSFHCPPGSLSSCPSLALPLDMPLPLLLGGGFPILVSRSALDGRHVWVCLSASPSPRDPLSFSYFHSSESPWCLEPKRSPGFSPTTSYWSHRQCSCVVLPAPLPRLLPDS